MTTTESVEGQHTMCECGCCGPAAATAVMEPPETKDKGTDATCKCECGCAAGGDGCDCGCTDRGCDCGCGTTEY